MLTGRRHAGQLGRGPSEGPWQRAREEKLRVENEFSVNGHEHDQSKSSNIVH